MGSLTLQLPGFYRLSLLLCLFATPQKQAAWQKHRVTSKDLSFFPQASRRGHNLQHTASLATG